MSIQNDIKTSQNDLRTISTLLGDALSQFAKLFQNEVDLAKAELGEKAQQVGGAIGFFAAGAILVIPALVMALFALSAALMAAGWSQPLSYLTSAIVAAVIAGVLFAIGINRLDRTQPGAAGNDAPARKGQGYREGNGAMSSTQGSFVDSVVTAARENPVAAALIGGGALWLLIGNEKLKSAASLATAAAFPSADTGARSQRSARSSVENTQAPPTAPEMDHEGSFGLGETLRHASNAASDAVSKATDQMKDGFEKGADYARDNFGKLGETLPGAETFTSAQSSLSRLFERQPLVLGAIGLAVGAAVAGAFRASDLENEWVGEYSDGVKGDLNKRAGAVSQSVREAADTLKNEIKDAGTEAFDRVKQAGVDAIDASRQKARTP